MRISFKIFLSLLSICVVIIALSLYYFHSYTSISTGITQKLGRIEEIYVSSESRLRVKTLIRKLLLDSVFNNKRDEKNIRHELTEAVNGLYSDIRVMEKTLSGQGVGKVKLEGYKREIIDYIAKVNIFLDIYDRGDLKAAYGYYSEKIEPLLQESPQKNSERALDALRTLQRDLAERFARMNGVSIYLTILALLSAVIFAYYMRRGIVIPVNKLNAAANCLAGGDIKRRVEISGRDELSVLAASFNRMAGEIESTRVQLESAHSYNEEIIGSLFDGLIVLSPDGTIERVNHAVYEMLGYPKDGLLGRFVDILLDNSGEDKYSSGIKFYEMFTKKGRVEMEHQLLNSEGKRVSFLISSVVMRDGSGAMKWVVLTLRDVTESRLAAARMKRNLDNQHAISAVLQIALEPIPLNKKLESCLDLILSIPWLTVQRKGCIFLTEDGSDVLVMIAQRHLHNELLERCARIPFGQCLCGLAASTRATIFANELNDLHEITFDGIAQHGHYAVPIRSGNRIHGVLNLYVEHGHVRDKSEEEFLTAMANSLAGIIEQGTIQERIRISEEFVYTMLNSMNDSIVVVNVSDFTIQMTNNVFLREYGLVEAEVFGRKTCHEILYDLKEPCREPAIVCPLVQTLQTGGFAHCEHILHVKRGGKIYVEGTTSPIRNKLGEITKVVYVLRDITERKKFETRLEELAHYDSLTGIPNRLLFFDRLKMAHELAKRGNTMLALLYLDLDRFKAVNDTLGHDVGDLLLKEAALRIKSSLIRDSDTLARMGGDEFTVILSVIDKVSSAQRVAERIIKSINLPFYLQGNICSVGTSIGIAIYKPDVEEYHCDDSRILIKRADIAMYRAKQLGRNNCQFYTHTIGRFDVVLDRAERFVLSRVNGWDHDAWLEFLNDLLTDGHKLSNEIKLALGSLLESLKRLSLELLEVDEVNIVVDSLKRQIRKVDSDGLPSHRDGAIEEVVEIAAFRRDGRVFAAELFDTMFILYNLFEKEL